MGNPVRFVNPDGRGLTKDEAAAMSAHVYGDVTQDKNVLERMGDWVPTDDYSNCYVKENENTGFKSQLYKNKETGEYCYVTVGTQADDVEDYITDVSHFLSNVTSQYVESMIYASNLSAAIGTKSKLSYSGHSLGGALAVCNSLVTGNSATTFNPAGISCRLYDFYAETFGFKGDEANITNYIMQGDIVNIANLFDKEIGTYHMMYHENGGFGGHSIDNFLEPTFTFTELLKKIYK